MFNSATALTFASPSSVVDSEEEEISTNSPLSEHLSTKSIKRTLSKVLHQYEHEFKNALSQEQHLWKERKRQLDEREHSIALKEHDLEKTEQALKEHVSRQVSEQVEKKRKEMMSEFAQRELKIAKLEEQVASTCLLENRLGPNRVIRLNVGGKLFCTFLSTLKNEKDSFFGAYFNDYFDPKPEQHDQAFFIDRPYEHFHLILNHLRGVDITNNLNKMKEDELSNFMEEVMFYQIPSIFNLFPRGHGKAMLMNKYGIQIPDMLFHPNYISSNAELSPDHRRVRKIAGDYDWNCSCLGKKE
ncbi:hypothetical protein FDP41_006698 [Naegleria fowleri]|uniref:BTB domain-containing protein n=1 Tax=Naegleria fowleri TaxID=5763 RepID=A0A6A5BJ51_NAEFO|nr:uncharacterized protein FDP41_006698 [Naegleria fowleri]KAF0974088.1 hypothetical protein FDP41_006698 [Naegleria fowleri]CAG4716243.1 unnamed protein product [Naegleria fowleri]